MLPSFVQVIRTEPSATGNRTIRIAVVSTMLTGASSCIGCGLSDNGEAGLKGCHLPMDSFRPRPGVLNRLGGDHARTAKAVAGSSLMLGNLTQAVSHAPS